jgi:hypothetical protein
MTKFGISTKTNVEMFAEAGCHYCFKHLFHKNL